MPPVNVAVIGSGFMGAAHVDALRRVPGVNVVAIASIDFPRAQELAAQFGITNVFDDWKALLGRDDVHAVHNCTPNNLHFEVNKAFIDAGKHVLSEKPLTMTSKESAELVRLARAKGVVTAINFNYRGYPLIQQARGMVARGELGELFLVHGHYLQDWLLHDTDYNWRLESKVSGASRAIADIGSHWFDLVQFITGRKITRVNAHLFRAHETRKKPKQEVETYKGKELGAPQEYDEVSIDTEDGGFVLIELEGGLRGSLVVSQVSSGRKNRQWIEVDGSRSALSWDLPSWASAVTVIAVSVALALGSWFIVETPFLRRPVKGASGRGSAGDQLDQTDQLGHVTVTVQRRREAGGLLPEVAGADPL